MEKRDFIFKDLYEVGGSEESARLYLVTTVRTGESELVLEYTKSERFPVQDLEKARDLFERLVCDGGRHIPQLKDLAHPFNPNPPAE